MHEDLGRRRCVPAAHPELWTFPAPILTRDMGDAVLRMVAK